MKRHLPRGTRRSTRAAVSIAGAAALLLSTGARAEVRGGQGVGPPLERHALSPAGTEPGPLSAGVLARAAPAAPFLTLDTGRELWFTSVSGRLGLAGDLLRERVRRVPLAGLDAGDIWFFDRGAAGRSDLAAGRSSDHARNAALLLPVVVSAFTARGPERLRDLAVAGVVYTEAVLITSTLTRFVKVLTARPRPGVYAPQPAAHGAPYAVLDVGAFHSMPSSHAAAAWTGASVALTHHLLLRPRAGWGERFGLGFAGGALGGAAAALRVHAGAHFPSDVVAGSGIGIAIGTLVPLAHRGHRPLPPRNAWLQTAAGVAAGTIVGVLLVDR
jgi:membrane-associated phospholipid phosphatase